MLGYFLIACIFLMPIFDFFAVYSRYIGNDSLERISLVGRAAILLFLLFLYAYGVPRKRVLLFCSFLLTQWLLWLNQVIRPNLEIGETLETSLMLLKFFLFFAFYDGMLLLIKNRAISEIFVYRVFTILIFVYSLAIVVGPFFDIEMFRYYSTDRWGFKGIVISGNEASALLIVSFAWSMLYCKGKSAVIIRLVVVMAMIFSGTKASIAGLVLLTISFFAARFKISSVLYLFLAVVISFIASFLAFNFIEGVEHAVVSTFSYFSYQFYNIANESLISLLLSGRDYKLDVVYSEIFRSYPWVLVLGGYPVASYTTEMDFFDLLAISGTIGVVIYFISWFGSWSITSHCDAFKRRFMLFFLVTFSVLAFLGGHMFYSAVAAPFLACFAVRFHLDGKKSLDL